MEKYSSIQQLMKKEEGEEKVPLFPPTVIQAVFDAKTGASLESILAQYNNLYVQYQGSVKDTRLIIPMQMRRAGLTITYTNMDSETITERASSAVQKDNDHWALDTNWTRVDELSLSGEIAVSTQGTWIINGEDTGIKAVGPKGDAGLTPWLKTIGNRLHFSYDNTTWEPCSGPIDAYFRWQDNKIQVSRDDRKTWTDLSGEFADNFRVRGYVSTKSDLPINAMQGDIYGVGPTYAEYDTEKSNPIYRFYVRNANTWVDNGAFTSIAAGIVQETGDSENAVMSQKAVSAKLSELGQEIRDNNYFGESNKGKVLAVGLNGFASPSVDITETNVSDNIFNPKTNILSLDIQTSTKTFISSLLGVMIPIGYIGQAGYSIMAKLFEDYTALGINTMGVVESLSMPQVGVSYMNQGYFSTTRNGAYWNEFTDNTFVSIYIKFNTESAKNSYLNNTLAGLYVRKRTSISWPSEYAPYSVSYIPLFYNKDETYNKEEIETLMGDKLSKIMDVSDVNKALVVTEDGSVKPAVTIMENAISSQNVFDYKTAKKLSLGIKESDNTFISNPACIMVLLPYKANAGDVFTAKFFLEQDFSSYGLSVLSFITSEDEANAGINYIDKGPYNMAGRSGGYIDSVSKNGLNLYLRLDFTSSANCSNYADYILSRTVVVKSNKITWPSEYSEYSVGYQPVFYSKKETDAIVAEKLDKNQGVENSGKFLKVASDGSIVFSELDSPGADLSDCIKKETTVTLFMGENLISSLKGSGNGWTESNGVYTHESGFTEPLVFDVPTEQDKAYVVKLYTGTATFFEHDVNVSIGNGELCDIYQGIIGPYYRGIISDGGKLKITPSSIYSNTVYGVEFREIVPESEAVESVTSTVSNVSSNTSKDNISGFWNTCISGGNSMTKNQNGSRNIAIGVNSLTEMRSGERNVAIGTFALNQLRWGVRNIAIGADALYRASRAKSNIAIGKAAAGYTHSDPTAHTYEDNTVVGDGALGGVANNYISNTMIGKDAGQGGVSSNKERNVGIGSEACYYGAMDNVAIGYRADRYSRGNNNVCIGANTGDITETGNNNILIGKEAKIYSGTGTSSNKVQHDNSIVIGYRAKANKSNQVVIGNKGQTEFIVLGNKKLNFNKDGTVTWEEVSDL